MLTNQYPMEEYEKTVLVFKTKAVAITRLQGGHSDRAKDT